VGLRLAYPLPAYTFEETSQRNNNFFHASAEENQKILLISSYTELLQPAYLFIAEKDFCRFSTLPNNYLESSSLGSQIAFPQTSHKTFTT